MHDPLKKQFCVIGDPIGHSLSPQIHGAVFRYFDLDVEYTAMHVTPDRLSDFVTECRTMGRPGFNVTIPHKQSIVSLLDKTDPLSDRIGAVNTVVNRGGALFGYNTDVQGFIFSLKDSGWIPDGTVLLFGAGGAARAAIEALAFLGSSTVVVSDINRDRLSEFQRHFQVLHPAMRLIAAASDSTAFETYVRQASLFINATPVGMWPNTEAVPVHVNWLPQTATVFDMVPRPIVTALLNQAKSYGLRTIPGLTMLIAQALESDALFLDRKIPQHLFTAVEDELYRHLEGHAKT